MAARVSGVWHTGSTRCGFSKGDTITRGLVTNVTWRNIETISKLDGTGTTTGTPGTDTEEPGEGETENPLE